MEHYLSLATLNAIMNFVKFVNQHPAILQAYQTFCRQQQTTPNPCPVPPEPL